MANVTRGGHHVPRWRGDLSGKCVRLQHVMGIWWNVVSHGRFPVVSLGTRLAPLSYGGGPRAGPTTKFQRDFPQKRDNLPRMCRDDTTFACLGPELGPILGHI